MLLLPVYASLLVPAAGIPALVLTLFLVGASYAATDGVLAALASSTLDEDVRGSGLAVLTTATNLARFVASVGFGALWTLAGLNTAVLVCGAALRRRARGHRVRAALHARGARRCVAARASSPCSRPRARWWRSARS